MRQSSSLGAAFGVILLPSVRRYRPKSSGSGKGCSANTLDNFTAPSPDDIISANEGRRCDSGEQSCNVSPDDRQPHFQRRAEVWSSLQLGNVAQNLSAQREACGLLQCGNREHMRKAASYEFNSPAKNAGRKGFQ